MLFKAYSVANRKKLIKDITTLTLLFSILLSFSILLLVLRHTYMLAYAETKFDFILQGFSEGQIDGIAALDFVKTVFPVRIFSGEIVAGNNKIVADTYAADSFTGIEVSYFSNHVILKKDKDIMTNQNLNPILIDRDIARTLRTGIGGKVSKFYGKEGREVIFTVAAICQPLENSLGRPVALILWRGEQRDIFYHDFGEGHEYSMMFIEVLDRNRAHKYFQEEYVPKWYLEEYGPLTEEELLEMRRDSAVINRETELENLYDEMRYAPPVIILISALGFIIFLIVLYREADKKVLMIEKEFFILNALGLPKRYFYIYYTVETMLMQIPVLLGATLITRFIIYEFIFNMYIPGYLLLRYAALAFLLQIIAVCISGCFINLALKKKDMASLLAKE